VVQCCRPRIGKLDVLLFFWLVSLSDIWFAPVHTFPPIDPPVFTDGGGGRRDLMLCGVLRPMDIRIKMLNEHDDRFSWTDWAGMIIALSDIPALSSGKWSFYVRNWMRWTFVSSLLRGPWSKIAYAEHDFWFNCASELIRIMFWALQVTFIHYI
jgi:hypothetical protein